MKIKLVKDKAPFKAPIQIYDNGATVQNRGVNMKNTSIKHKEKIFFSYDERQEFLEKNKDKILDYDLQTINGTHGEEYILFYDYEEV